MQGTVSMFGRIILLMFASALLCSVVTLAVKRQPSGGGVRRYL